MSCKIKTSTYLLSNPHQALDDQYESEVLGDSLPECHKTELTVTVSQASCILVNLGTMVMLTDCYDINLLLQMV